MPRGGSKAYAAWLRAHGVEDANQTPPYADVIQPVVVIDDVSHLPQPVVPPFAGVNITVAAAGAGTYCGFDIVAIGGAFRIGWLYTSSVVVSRIAQASPLDNNRNPASWTYEDNATAQLFEGDASGAMSGIVLPSPLNVGLVVPRGYMFTCVNFLANNALAMLCLEIQEAPGQ